MVTLFIMYKKEKLPSCKEPKKKKKKRKGKTSENWKNRLCVSSSGCCEPSTSTDVRYSDCGDYYYYLTNISRPLLTCTAARDFPCDDKK
ncbi:hypothetical protein POVWA2_013180 [Plasmodium ovale wallikeri]|uniref:Uncharacterized protein n=1 Tax=Plasmodium ovale wallikeri TaxID=864142 RepID=A0A1A8YLY3_PLAOA|nr:hypothetical protein POVWA1_012510 [Plasmodium ovale wallikeri]SBT33136.1 hypothetical protein POVWA2_013180 [Plasmodium ovale wallikeri]